MQRQIATFFASDGTLIVHPEPTWFFEVPLVGPLPEDLNYIRKQRRYPPASPRASYRDEMSVVSLDRVSVAYGYLRLLDELALQVEARERVAVIGRNGSGKSTL